MIVSGVHADLRELVALRARARELAQAGQRRSENRMSGGQSSPFRGRGMEYAESRPYAAGDDVRHIDWRVTARTGRTHTKLFQPERERVTALVYDAAPAMAFGTRACFKSVQAARIGSLLTWLALSEGDRLAAGECGGRGEVIQPLGGRRGALRVLDGLVRWQPESGVALPSSSPGVPLATTLDALYRVLRPGSHILLLLDARSVDAAGERSLARLRAHHDLAACVLVDPIETTAPRPQRYRVSDGRDRGTLLLDAQPQRDRWREHFDAQHRDALDRLRRAGARARLVATDEDPVDALRQLLRGAPTREAAA
ncbi:DUF58 domain-containing protein [Chiayiivirga flava]|uniref:Uncharacterized protein (DUF58 family) n=1 Tax=Chiayiivirga flava TaxID=659595 RepID=A0A7W8D816_9GAMM|nr:DUF58 domain-containing protein [Chiayiivirga flava]MBB5209307.1 uncharacterized protein (DUF58 family) [Chiayiivirga flava]